MNSSPSQPLERKVGAQEGGQRLDRFLTQQPEVVSRSHAKKLVEQGKVSVDGKALKAGQLLSPGQVVRFDPKLDLPVPQPGVRPGGPAAEPTLEILHEDDYLLVVDKPAGLACHPAEGLRPPETTLVDLAVAHCPDLTVLPGDDRPGIVHRLDRETSGVMVIAKTDEAYLFLKGQFKSRQVHKEYRAIAYGEARFDSDYIERNIATDPRRGDRMTVVKEGGRAASTYYEVVTRYRDFTHFRCLPKTGRTHQIRVHLMSIGHALVGDRLYRSRRTQSMQLPDAAPDPGRHCLHARALGFRHPRSREDQRFEASVPADMTRLLRWLDANKSLDT
ncbi:MAG: RluA family pseudouridine synthase [Planctomycetota bacterium]